jgi:hypothetical protein
LNDITTVDEYKCLNQPGLSYTNTKLFTEVKRGCLRKKRNGKKEMTKNGKKKNGKSHEKTHFSRFFFYTSFRRVFKVFFAWFFGFIFITNQLTSLLSLP